MQESARGRKELNSTRWAGNSLVFTAGSACFPRSDSGTMKSLSLEAQAALTLSSRGLCFAQHLLHVLQAQYKVACKDLLRAAATAPMHGMAPAGQGRAGSSSCSSCLGPGAGQNHGRTQTTAHCWCHILALVSLFRHCPCLAHLSPRALFTPLSLSHISRGLRWRARAVLTAQ